MDAVLLGKIRRFSMLSRALRLAFCAVFICAFSAIGLGVLFNRDVYAHTTPILLVWTGGFAGILLASYCFLARHALFCRKHFGHILCAACALLFAIQIIIGNQLRFEPQYDLEAIYRGAQEWVKTGTFTAYSSRTCHVDYFYIFPNNLGGLFLLYVLFKAAAWVGIADFFGVAMVFNGLLCVGTMAVTALACKKSMDATTGVFAALLFLLSPPFYLMAPVFYTDTLSMIFPIGIYALYLRAKDGRGRGRRLWMYAVMGVLAAIGALLKPTVLVIAIAIAIAQLLFRHWRECALYVLVSVCTITAVSGAFNGFMYSGYLSREKARQTNMPYSYWLSMGLSGEGGFRHTYFALARSIDDPQARDEALRAVIVENLKEQGTRQTLQLMEDKATLAFGDGTYALSDFLDDQPCRPGPLHDYLLYEGKRYDAYSCFATGIFMAIFLFMLLSGGQGAKRPELFVPQLSIFGVMLFLLFWEVNSRYIINIIPLLFVCAAAGVRQAAPACAKGLRTMRLWIREGQAQEGKA